MVQNFSVSIQKKVTTPNSTFIFFPMLFNGEEVQVTDEFRVTLKFLDVDLYLIDTE